MPFYESRKPNEPEIAIEPSWIVPKSTIVTNNVSGSCHVCPRPVRSRGRFDDLNLSFAMSCCRILIGIIDAWIAIQCWSELSVNVPVTELFLLASPFFFLFFRIIVSRITHLAIGTVPYLAIWHMQSFRWEFLWIDMRCGYGVIYHPASSPWH